MGDTRITGIMSGMDTDSLVQKLVDANKYPLNKAQQQKTLVEWKRQAILDINSKLLSFRNEAFNMKLDSAYTAFDVQNSHKDSFTVSATSEAKEGTYNLTIDNLATKTKLVGNTKVGNTIKSSWDPGKIDWMSLADTDFNITVNGVTKNIKWGSDEGFYSSYEELAKDLQKKIDNEFGAGEVTVNFIDETKEEFQNNGNQHVIEFVASDRQKGTSISVSAGEVNALDILGIESGSNNAFSTDAELGRMSLSAGGINFDDNGEAIISVGGKDFTINEKMTLDEVFQKINRDQDIDVNIKYDKLEDKIVMERRSTGAGKEIYFDEGDSNFFTALGIAPIDDYDNPPANYIKGENALITLKDPEGNIIEDVEMTSNSFTLQGVSITLLDEDLGASKSFSVSRDVDAVYDKIENFVNKYNELMETLNVAYNEEKNKDYAPLTDDEREQLSEKQQEQWEEKAKSGILRRDSTLSSTINSIRRAATDILDTVGLSSLYEIGISTVSYDRTGKDNGKLEINETKLKEAIREKPDEVANIFNSTPEPLTGAMVKEEVNLDGTSFFLTVENRREEIRLEGTYDTTTTEGKNALLKELEEKISEKFGEFTVTVTMSSKNKITFANSDNYELRVEEGEGDALDQLGFIDGQEYANDKKGVAVKLYDAITLRMDDIVDKAGTAYTKEDNSAWGKLLAQHNKEIAKQRDKLAELEEYYYKQFTAMEQALSKLNEQSSSLSGLFSFGQ